MMSFEFIRNRRKELGMTQEQLAEKAGFSLKVAQRFEAKYSYNPSYRIIISLINALEVDFDFLVFECIWPD
jgi:transcriptional regulator with XRE-family HTH domain